MGKPTPEETAAIEQLHQAIANLIRVRGWDNAAGDPLLLTEWLVIASQQGFDSEGESRSSCIRFEGPGWQMPWTTTLGLLRIGTLMAEEAFRDDGED